MPLIQYYHTLKTSFKTSWILSLCSPKIMTNAMELYQRWFRRIQALLMERLTSSLWSPQMQVLQINRCVRRYHGSTGKRCVVNDEFLEHGNRFYSVFPMVGLGFLCRKFCDLWYTINWQEHTLTTYTASVKPKMTPEKWLIYEVFKLLSLHIFTESCLKISQNYVTSI